MSKSQRYWEKRKARELYAELVKAEEAAEELRQVYIKAANDIEQQAAGIFRRFQLKNNLNVADAERLLQQIKTPDDIDALVKALRADPKNKELVAELESQAYAARINRLAAVQRAVDTTAIAILGQAKTTTTAALVAIGQAMYYREIFAMQQRANAAFPFAKVSAEQVLQILNTRWEGASFSERLWTNTQGMADAVKEQLILGILTGRSQQRMVKEIEKKFSGGYNATRRLVRTEANYVANELQAKSYENTGVEKYIYVAILDLRTSLICRSLDKKVFALKDKQVGENYPPMHPWCRSTTIAWMPPELLHKLQQAAINPNTGETIHVPGDMAYEEWYQRYITSTPQASSDNFGSLKYYTIEELQELNQKAGEIVDRYIDNESKHTGILHTFPEDSKLVAQKNWDCSITLRHESSMHLAIHENIHAHSASYYGQDAYITFRPYEEGPVELLAQNICKAEGYEYAATSAYKPYVDALREVYEIAKDGFSSELDFATQLIHVPLQDRRKWLISLEERRTK